MSAVGPPCRPITSSVASLGGRADRPGWHHRCDTRMKVYFAAKFTRTLDKPLAGKATITKKVITFWGEKKRWHHQLPHRVTPTLVTSLNVGRASSHSGEIGYQLRRQRCDESAAPWEWHYHELRASQMKHGIIIVTAVVCDRRTSLTLSERQYILAVRECHRWYRSWSDPRPRATCSVLSAATDLTTIMLVKSRQNKCGRRGATANPWAPTGGVEGADGLLDLICLRHKNVFHGEPKMTQSRASVAIRSVELGD